MKTIVSFSRYTWKRYTCLRVIRRRDGRASEWARTDCGSSPAYSCNESQPLGGEFMVNVHTSTLTPLSLCRSRSCGSRGLRCGRLCGGGRRRSRWATGWWAATTTDSSSDGTVFDVDTTEIPVFRSLVSHNTKDAKMPVGRVCARWGAPILNDLFKRVRACRSPEPNSSSRELHNRAVINNWNTTSRIFTHINIIGKVEPGVGIEGDIPLFGTTDHPG